MVEREKEIEEFQRNWCLSTNERMLVYNDEEIKKWTVHTMACSKQEDSYNCGVCCLILCFDVQTKKNAFI
uniref:Uncharacterized protein n=1 Tax=Magallana gigas TaxID=29159 RepID=A0A8W8JQL4_MAGGI